MAEYMRGERDRKRKFAEENPDDPRHGTLAFHSNFGCKCLLCRQARNDYVFERRQGVPREYKIELMEAQGGKCASCREPFNDSYQGAHLDHNHDTGEIRGVLCGQCNLALGLLMDNVERIAGLLRYRNSYSKV